MNDGDNDGTSGSVFYFVVEIEKTIKLERCEFLNCTIDSENVGNGGSIYIEIKDGGYFELHNTLFKDCYSNSSKNGEGKGYYVYLYVCVQVYKCECNRNCDRRLYSKYLFNFRLSIHIIIIIIFFFFCLEEQFI
jgi:hypothetical protein